MPQRFVQHISTFFNKKPDIEGRFENLSAVIKLKKKSYTCLFPACNIFLQADDFFAFCQVSVASILKTLCEKDTSFTVFNFSSFISHFQFHIFACIYIYMSHAMA